MKVSDGVAGLSVVSDTSNYVASLLEAGGCAVWSREQNFLCHFKLHICATVDQPGWNLPNKTNESNSRIRQWEIFYATDDGCILYKHIKNYCKIVIKILIRDKAPCCCMNCNDWLHVTAKFIIFTKGWTGYNLEIIWRSSRGRDRIPVVQFSD